jgi:hypothetical protein
MNQRRPVRRNFGEQKSQKSIAPNLIFTILLWLSLSFIIYFIDPSTFAIIPIFLILFFSSIFFTLSIFTKKLITKLIISSSFTLFLILRYFALGNIVNFFLLSGITITILAYESYFKKSN